jgi:tRNA A-37 threonylcarbamoyl transferase component Bud32
MKNKIQTGGLFIRPAYDEESAFNYFISNCTFTLLTYNSIGCITLKAKLNDNVKSPYIHLRINKWNKPLKCILIKILLYEDITTFHTRYINLPNVRTDNFEISNHNSFMTEINNQIKLYLASYVDPLSPLDPFSPALLYYKINIDKPNIDNFISYIEQHFTDNEFVPELNMDKITIMMNFLNAIEPNGYLNKSIIVMEFLDDFKPLVNYINNTTPDTEVYKYIIYTLFETIRLHKLGYMHNDLHLNNIFINPTETYFTMNTNSAYLGRAIIIDFGRLTFSHDLERRFNNLDILQKIYQVLSTEKFGVLAQNLYVDSVTDDMNEIFTRRSKISQKTVLFINNRLAQKNTSLDFIFKNAPYSGISGGRTTQSYVNQNPQNQLNKIENKPFKVKSMFANEPLDTSDEIMKFLTEHNQAMIRDINSGKFMVDIKNIINQKYKGGKKTKNKRRKRKTRRNKL